MADKFHSDTQEKIESITYTPGCPNTGDLEPATKTITAMSEASGLENADYSQALTLSKPDDARLVVKRIAARLKWTCEVTVEASYVYCRVYVDAQDADHMLFDTSRVSGGDVLEAVDTHSGNKSTIFDLLKDGSAHTFYFFFWKNAEGATVTVSYVELWEGVGTKQTDYYSIGVLEIDHNGLASADIYLTREGTGSISGRIRYRGHPYRYIKQLANSSISDNPIEIILLSNNDISVGGTVATDLNYLSRIEMALRSLQ